MMSRVWRCALLAVVAGPAAAQDLGTLPRDTVNLDVRSASDPTQKYAVYIPSGCSVERRCPLALLMDPRGRAELPLRLVQGAVVRREYIVVSSYNTVSDSTPEPNVAAMTAMLADIASVPYDAKRIYLVGFSGTSRIAWDFAAQIPGVAGILGTGSTGIVFAREWKHVVPRVAYYGVIGRHDFTYDELVVFEPWLRELSIPHRLRNFEGPHAWPPAPLMESAFEWFELRAMRDSLRAVDSAFVAARYAADLAEADSLERAGYRVEAYDLWRAMVADYRGLRDVASAERKVAALERSAALREQQQARVQALLVMGAYQAVIDSVSRELAQSARARSAKDIAKALQVGALERITRDRDREAAASAQRQLEQAYVQLSFYLPLDLMRAGEPERALRALDVAELVKRGTGRVALFRARAFVLMNQVDEALAAVRAALDRGMSPAGLRADPSLAPLRADTRFMELVGRGQS